MELDIFQSEKGDCLLLTGADGRRVLCDGGMYGSMRAHVAPALANLRGTGPGPDIDHVYVSHIDQDHIAGVLSMLRDELEWRVHEYRKSTGAGGKKPGVPRPPRLGGIWHNAFRDQIGRNTGPVAELVAAAAPTFAMTRLPDLEAAAEEMRGIAASINEALEVSKLAAAGLLDIPVNAIPEQQESRQLMLMRGDATDSFAVGGMRFTIVGPGDEELARLRDGWNNWLRANKAAVAELREKMRRQLERFAESSDPSAFDLGGWNGIPDYKGVTPPNVASLMFMVEENGKRLLLTGDSQQDIIETGLRAQGFLNGHLHLDVMKVPHHGSENNYDPDFARLVTADHYVFCGNGEHENPDLRVVQYIYDAHTSGDPAVRGLAPEARNDSRPFTFWFSTSAKTNAVEKAQPYWARLEKLVTKLVQASGGRLTVRYNDGDFVRLTI